MNLNAASWEKFDPKELTDNPFRMIGDEWMLVTAGLPAFCHAESLIHAVRFFRKEKSSLLRAGYSLRRRGYERSTTRSGLSAP